MDRNYPLHAPLHLAAKGCDLELVTKMIEGDGGDVAVWAVNVTDNAGWVPLHEAARNSCPFHGPAIVEYLLSQGGDVNAIKWDGDTPLHDASAKGLVKNVEILLQHGSDPSATNIDGKTPYDMASKPEIKLILEKAEERRRVRLGLPPVPLIQEPI